MPIFRETKHILNDDGEVFESSWMIHNNIVYPETQEWDYRRELRIDDIEIWEVIREWSAADVLSNGGRSGIYAAWRPHAELYMIKLPVSQGGVVTFYGINAEKECRKFLDSKGIEYFPYPNHYEPGITVDRKGINYKYKF